MSLEMTAAAIAPGSASAPAAGGNVQAGYGVSLSDISGFENSMTQAGLRLEAQATSPVNMVAKQMMQPFEHINAEAKQIEMSAQAAKAEGRDLTPSEMVSMTAKCQEFSFHCSLMSNIANKTSEGLSQLFRQQS